MIAAVFTINGNKSVQTPLQSLIREWSVHQERLNKPINTLYSKPSNGEAGQQNIEGRWKKRPGLKPKRKLRRKSRSLNHPIGDSERHNRERVE